MLTSESVDEVKSLTVPPRPIEVVISEDGLSPLSLVLPPYDDLNEVATLRGNHFSLKETTVDAFASIREALNLERSVLEGKHSRFRSSTTYLNRLANLAALVGEPEAEEAYLTSASAIASDPFFSERLADNYIARNRIGEAVHLLEGVDLSGSVSATLRLAAIFAARNEIERSEALVQRALALDPIDFGARLFHGALRLWAGDNQSAILSFRVAAQQRPNSAALRTNIAIAYMRLGLREKALKNLKLAIAIDPLNQNTVCLLADVAFAEGVNEDAIPSLRYFVRYEQKSAEVWGRLGRALFRIGEANEAIAALKRQASIQDGSSVWNNLGVAYFVKNDYGRAVESFKHAMSIANNVREVDYCIAAKNAFGLISTSSRVKPNDIVKGIDEVVSTENADVFRKLPEPSMIFIAKLQSLLKAGRSQEAMQLGDGLLDARDTNEELRIRIAIGLMKLYSLFDPMSGRDLAIARQFSDLALKGKIRRVDDRFKLLNNIAFVFLEHDQLDVAETFLAALSKEIHVRPFPTATLGLFHLKRGHIEKATELYDEAIRLANDAEEKVVIKQKRNLELGKALFATTKKKAIRLLTLARDEKRGEISLANQAGDLLKMLSN